MVTKAPWQNADGVETATTFRFQPLASCSGCDWTRRSGNGDDWPAIRQAARRHVASSGHVVDAAVTSAYRYRRQAPARKVGAHV